MFEIVMLPPFDGIVDGWTAKRIYATKSLGEMIKEHTESMKQIRKLANEVKSLEFKEIGMEKKLFRVGAIVEITEEPMKGEEGVVVEMGHWERMVWVRRVQRTLALGLNSMKEVTPEPQLSGEELAEMFDEYCESRKCCECPLSKEMLSCDEDTVKNVLKYYDALVEEVTSYKAQKEQEKKPLFKPGDIVKYKLREGARPFVVTSESFESLCQDNYVLVCRAEDRVDK